MLDTEYRGVERYYRWKCSIAEHPVWEADWSKVKGAKSWCPTCGGNPRQNPAEALSDMHAYAEARGGKLLSKVFTSKGDHYEWKCSNPEHPSWFSTWAVVKDKEAWCSICSGVRVLPEKALQTMRDHAAAKGGQLLDTEYRKGTQKFLWKCAVMEHPPFNATWGNLKNNNTWCAKCSADQFGSGISEEISRALLECLYSAPFPPALPECLPGSDGSLIPFIYSKRLALDGYSPELGLAFEYMGKQHYRPVSLFGGEDGFKRTQLRDAVKRDLIAKSTITLVELKGIEDVLHWPPERLINALVSQLRAQGFDVRGLDAEECKQVVERGVAAGRAKRDRRKHRKQMWVSGQKDTERSAGAQLSTS